MLNRNITLLEKKKQVIFETIVFIFLSLEKSNLNYKQIYGLLHN